MGAIDRMLLHVSTCAARSITPSQPSPIEGEGSKERRDASLRERRSQPGEAFTGSLRQLFLLRRLFIGRQRPSPMMGKGLGGGDAAQLVGDRLMHAVAATRSCWPPSISTINRA